MAARKQPTPGVITSRDQIPAFESEQQEADFWSVHRLGQPMLDQMGSLDDVLPPPRPRTVPIAVRFDRDILQRIRALARAKGKGYQTLLKEFVVERLYEEEKRAGIVGGADGRG